MHPCRSHHSSMTGRQGNSSKSAFRTWPSRRTKNFRLTYTLKFNVLRDSPDHTICLLVVHCPTCHWWSILWCARDRVETRTRRNHFHMHSTVEPPSSSAANGERWNCWKYNSCHYRNSQRLSGDDGIAESSTPVTVRIRQDGIPVDRSNESNDIFYLLISTVDPPSSSATFSSSTRDEKRQGCWRPNSCHCPQTQAHPTCVSRIISCRIIVSCCTGSKEKRTDTRELNSVSSDISRSLQVSQVSSHECLLSRRKDKRETHCQDYEYVHSGPDKDDQYFKYCSCSELELCSVSSPRQGGGWVSLRQKSKAKKQSWIWLSQKRMGCKTYFYYKRYFSYHSHQWKSINFTTLYIPRNPRIWLSQKGVGCKTYFYYQSYQWKNVNPTTSCIRRNPIFLTEHHS